LEPLKSGLVRGPHPKGISQAFSPEVDSLANAACWAEAQVIETEKGEGLGERKIGTAEV